MPVVTMIADRPLGAQMLQAGTAYDLDDATAASLIAGGFARAGSKRFAQVLRPVLADSNGALFTSDRQVVGGGTLTQLLRNLQTAARNANPWDLGVMASPATVTVNPAALANPVTYGYFDTNGHRRINMWGCPYGDRTLTVSGQKSNTYVRFQSISNVGGDTTLFGGQMATVNVRAQRVQWVIDGLSVALNRIRVNGRWASTTPVSVGNSAIEVDLGTPQFARIDLEFEQGQQVRGVTVGQDDTVFALEAPPEPLVLITDSYGFGTTSPQGLGANSLVGILRDVSGLNVIPQGVTSSGWTVGITLNNELRRQRVLDVINASGARLVAVALGTNDHLLSATPSAVREAVMRDLGFLVNNTACNFVVFGAWPRNTNLSTSLLAIDAAILEAVNTLNPNRVAFGDINGINGGTPWVTGTRDADTATGTAGNSRFVTGNDGTHLNPAGGTEYMARKMLDGLIATCAAKGW